jgi:Ser/Thr protein kinase RdoA (MazF antagonist)
LVTGDALTYVFKIYRPGWRDAPAVLWEIDLLAHLSKQGAPVANAIPRSDGRAITAIEAAEGIDMVCSSSMQKGETTTTFQC